MRTPIAWSIFRDHPVALPVDQDRAVGLSADILRLIQGRCRDYNKGDVIASLLAVVRMIERIEDWPDV